jgi:hypothetical protein
MERGLRELIARQPTEAFRGVYLESGLSPTRKNILAPGSIGVYTASSNYNPAQIVRDESVKYFTERIDIRLKGVGNKAFIEITIEEINEIIALTMPDQSQSEHVWDSIAVEESLTQYTKLRAQRTGYVYVDRERELEATRRETQGILTGGEVTKVPGDKITLFLLRTTSERGKFAAWWPQIRFPDGNYAFAFAV